MSPAEGAREFFILFDDARTAVSRGLVSFLEALPGLSDDQLLDADLGVNGSTSLFSCLVRLRGPLTPEARARLAFWAWRLGGFIAPLPPPTTAGATVTAAKALAPLVEATACHVPADGFGPAARLLVARLPAAAEEATPSSLHLHLWCGSKGDAGMSFSRRDQSLFVPSPLSPPLGDCLDLRLHPRSAPPFSVEGIVTEQLCARGQGAGTPAGFVVGLVHPSQDVLRLLEQETSLVLGEAVPRAPRYAACLPASVSLRVGDSPGARSAPAGRPQDDEPSADEYVENLSQGGAFVNSPRRLAPGTPVRLSVLLFDGETITLPGLVVHANLHGFGVRFELDAAGEAQVARAVQLVASRRARAFVVDDDALARTMVGDALTELGFKVFAAKDAASGLAVLTDQILAPDLLVTDLHMPGHDGEELIKLIRGAGGEHDLAILVVTGDEGGPLERRLLDAGADAVFSKGGGVAALQEAAMRALIARARLRAEFRRQVEAPTGTGAAAPGRGTVANRRVGQPMATANALYTSTGFAPIDRDHHALVDTLIELIDTVNAGKAGEVASALAGVVTGVEAHFGHEAALMEAFAYPLRRAHLEAHGLFVGDVLRFKRELEQRGVTANFRRWALGRLREWFRLHILTHDVGLGRFLSRIGAAEIPGQEAESARATRPQVIYL